MEEELVLLARFDTPFAVEEARIALEEAKIECLVADALTGDVGLIGGASIGGVRLFVWASDLARAVEALADTPARKDLVVEPPEEEAEAEEGQEA